jgi:hypothetical protein
VFSAFWFAAADTDGQAFDRCFKIRMGVFADEEIDYLLAKSRIIFHCLDFLSLSLPGRF